MTATLSGGRNVAKTRGRGRPKKPGGEGKHVRLNAELVAKARIVALRQGSQIGEYLSELLDGPVNRDYQRVLRELKAEGAETD
jgi:hypothetical protein